MAFGKLIRDSRSASGMTLAELAAEIDLSIAYLSRIERDRENPPRDDLIRKIAAALGLAEDDAFGAARRLPPDLQDKAGEVIAAYRRFAAR